MVTGGAPRIGILCAVRYSRLTEHSKVCLHRQHNRGHPDTSVRVPSSIIVGGNLEVGRQDGRIRQRAAAVGLFDATSSYRAMIRAFLEGIHGESKVDI